MLFLPVMVYTIIDMKNTIISFLTALVTTSIVVAIGIAWIKIDLTKVQNQLTSLQMEVDALPQNAGLQDTPQVNKLNQPVSPQDQGPVNHSVYITTSDDPNSFNDSDTVVFEKASVPDAVRLHTTSAVGEAGDLLMYFPSFENFTGSGSEGLVYSRSTDNGVTWSDRTPVTIEGKQNSGAAVDPSLVQLEDGSLRLYFFGSETTTGDPASVEGDHVIYSALSTDGVTFTVEEGERLAMEKITDPEVIQLNDTWIMYVSRGSETLIATSLDGLNFTLQKTGWDQGGIPGAFVDSENIVHIYGCGRGGIVTQTSTNGITFEDPTVVPALQGQPGTSAPEIICDPSPVLLDNDVVLLVYKKAPGNSSPTTELPPLDKQL